MGLFNSRLIHGTSSGIRVRDRNSTERLSSPDIRSAFVVPGVPGIAVGVKAVGIAVRPPIHGYASDILCGIESALGQ